MSFLSIKALVFLLVCSFVPASAFALVDEALAPPVYMTISLPDTQLLNVRKRPRKDASAWDMLRGGSELYVTELNGAWATVDYGGETGYAQLRFLEIPAGVDCVVVSDGRVRIRDSPNGTVLDFAKVGEILTVQAWQYDKDGVLWARLSSGYVMAAFLERVEATEYNATEGESLYGK